MTCYLRRCNGIIKDGQILTSFYLVPPNSPRARVKVLNTAYKCNGRGYTASPPTHLRSSSNLALTCHTVTKGTVEVQDEVLPENDDDDMTYETGGKSTLRIVLKISDGIFEGKKRKNKEILDDRPSEIVFEDHEYMDML